MIKVIHTPCSRTASIIDASMTAVGWTGFLYLVVHGLFSVSLAGVFNENLPAAQNMLPTLQTLLIYLTIAVFNAMLFTVWGTYRKRIFPDLHRSLSRNAPDDEITANKFAISSTLVHAAKHSQITTIHHNDDGAIATVVTDRLRIPSASNSDYFDTAHLA